jgi:cytochrome c peroxidase
VAWRGPLTRVDPTLFDPVEQMHTPLYGRHPVEMGTDPATLPGKLSAIAIYPPAFEAAWPNDPNPITMEHVEQALFAYELLIIGGNTPYDRYLLGDREALSADQQAGMALFYSERTGCGGCHGGLFFDLPATPDGTPIAEMPEYLNIGLYNIDGAGGLPPDETGLHARTGDPSDMGRFRVPSLRGVAETGPWAHDGSYGALTHIIDDYARGGRLLVGGPWPGDGRDSPLKDPRIRGFELTETERGQLVAFLEALTDVDANTRPFLQTPFCPDDAESGDSGCIPVEP